MEIRSSTRSLVCSLESVTGSVSRMLYLYCIVVCSLEVSASPQSPPSSPRTTRKVSMMSLSTCCFLLSSVVGLKQSPEISLSSHSFLGLQSLLTDLILGLTLQRSHLRIKTLPSGSNQYPLGSIPSQTLSERMQKTHLCVWK